MVVPFDVALVLHLQSFTYIIEILFCQELFWIFFVKNILYLFNFYLKTQSGPPAELVVCTSPIRAYYRHAPIGGADKGSTIRTKFPAGALVFQILFASKWVK